MFDKLFAKDRDRFVDIVICIPERILGIFGSKVLLPVWQTLLDLTKAVSHPDLIFFGKFFVVGTVVPVVVVLRHSASSIVKFPYLGKLGSLDVGCKGLKPNARKMVKKRRLMGCLNDQESSMT